MSPDVSVRLLHCNLGGASWKRRRSDQKPECAFFLQALSPGGPKQGNKKATVPGLCDFGKWIRGLGKSCSWHVRSGWKQLVSFSGSCLSSLFPPGRECPWQCPDPRSQREKGWFAGLEPRASDWESPISLLL